jgi:uncharacterized membrane protein
MPLLIVAYPVLAHLATLRHDPWLQWAALSVLVAIPLYERLRGGRLVAWLIWAGVCAGLWVLVFAGGGQYALFLPPVLLPMALGLLFGESLLPGRTPLITRVARAARGGSLPSELALYTRRVTMLWTAVLFGTGVTAGLLAWLAPLPAWSLFTNLWSYVILAAVFPLEYAWRRWRYRQFEHPGFWDHLKLVARTNYRRV